MGAMTPCSSTQARKRSGSWTNWISGFPAKMQIRTESSRKRKIPVPAIHRFCFSVNDRRWLIWRSFLWEVFWFTLY